MQLYCAFIASKINNILIPCIHFNYAFDSRYLHFLGVSGTFNRLAPRVLTWKHNYDFLNFLLQWFKTAPFNESVAKIPLAVVWIRRSLRQAISFPLTIYVWAIFYIQANPTNFLLLKGYLTITWIQDSPALYTNSLRGKRYVSPFFLWNDRQKNNALICFWGP